MMSIAIAHAAQEGGLRRSPAPESRTPPRPAGEPGESVRLQRCACGGSCPACRAKAAAAALPINDRGDAWEREADAAADAVMSGGFARGGSSTAAPALRRCACGGGCPSCRAKKEDETLRREDAGSGSGPGIAPPIVHDVLASPGQPLDAGARAFMEERFGADFGGVRVHDGARAAESARAVDAHAYTVGDHVVFGAGRYAPGTAGGDRLIAHELAHTLQQDGTARRAAAPMLQRQVQGETEPPNALGDANDVAPRCPPTPTNLGLRPPETPCATDPHREIGHLGRHFLFCLDSDQLTIDTPATVAAFARGQPADARFVVHGYASRDGDPAYNRTLACHRANRMRTLLAAAEVPASRIELASKGATDEFAGGPAANRVVVVHPAVRRFGEADADPACPTGHTGLGDVTPEPACADDAEDLLQTCSNTPDAPIGSRAAECDFIHFCKDSDVLTRASSPADIANFAHRQAAGAAFVVQGFASEEGARQYNLNLSCHRAKRVARELLNAGVQPERIRMGAKGESAQVAGGLESNRIVIIHARPPAAGPGTPAPVPENRKRMTQEEKHALIRHGIDRIERGDYALGADAYISFWTCGRVPTLRHAVAATRYLAEGDPGTPPATREPGAINPGATTGLGLNNVMVSNEILQDVPQCIFDAVARMAFATKVRDAEVGPEHGRGSLRSEGAEHMVFLGDLSCETVPRAEDPLEAAKGAPACQGLLPQTGHGSVTPADRAAKVPGFLVREFSALTTSGLSVMDAVPERNILVLSTAKVPVHANAHVELQKHPQEFGNYQVGFMLTVSRDDTALVYSGGETSDIRLPVPLRGTDGTRAEEPWFADDAVEVPRDGRANPLLIKQTGQELPLRFNGEGTGPATGSPIRRVTRTAEYQLWLVARRRGAPLDRFSTNILQGTRVTFDQTLLVTDPPRGAAVGLGSGTYTTRVPATGSSSDALRFSGPLAEDLRPQETATTNQIPACEASFNGVRFTLTGETAESVSGVIGPHRRREGGLVSVVLDARSPVKYTPTVHREEVGRSANRAKFQVGLVQNILGLDGQAEYTGGEQVNERTEVPPPLRDGAPPGHPAEHPVFMSTANKEFGEFTGQRKEVGLSLGDTPSIAFLEDLATHPFCPGRRKGVMRRITGRNRFRTWVVARRVSGDDEADVSCSRRLHHVDWEMDWAASVNPDRLEKQALNVTAQGPGGPPFVTGKVRPITDDTCG